MAWVKVDDAFPDHPKVLVLSLAAQGLWLSGLCYANRLMTDGHIPAALLRRLGDQDAWKAAEELVAVGLWTESASGWEIHDYLRYQRSREQIEGLSERRAVAGRAGGEANAKQTGSKPEANAKQTQANPKQKRKEEKRTEERREETDAARTRAVSDELPQGFAQFWETYPLKRARPTALAAWRKRKFNEGEIAAVLRALERQKVGWSDPRYIPHPATWINQERWNDESPAAGPGRRGNGANPFLELLQEEHGEPIRDDEVVGRVAHAVSADGGW